MHSQRYSISLPFVSSRIDENEKGNKNREIHQSTPDHRVPLTTEGWQQAHEAGRKLRTLLRPTDTVHFFVSPYLRTRQTAEGMLAELASDDPTPSPFPRHTIKVYEEPRLREQDFGNFQPDAAEMSRMWQERANYGHCMKILAINLFKGRKLTSSQSSIEYQTVKARQMRMTEYLVHFLPIHLA
jgi:bisphosphoglycerate-dependent phosphoglycerate mutase